MPAQQLQLLAPEPVLLCLAALLVQGKAREASLGLPPPHTGAAGDKVAGGRAGPER